MVSEVRTVVTIIKEGDWKEHWDGEFWALTVLFLDFDASLTGTFIL